MLCLLGELQGFENFKSEISNLKSLAEEIGRQLRGWAEFLQESPIKGQKFLTQKTRQLDRARREREEMMRELRQIQEGASR